MFSGSECNLIITHEGNIKIIFKEEIQKIKRMKKKRLVTIVFVIRRGAKIIVKQETVRVLFFTQVLDLDW